MKIFRDRPIRPRSLGTIAVVLGLTLAVAGLAASSANAHPRIHFSEPKIPGTKVACFDYLAEQLVAKAHPTYCNLSGYKAETEEDVTVHLERVDWGHWGAGRTQGARGFDVYTDRRLRVILYRRITCPDDSTWYANAVILDLRTGDAFALRLPVCRNAALANGKGNGADRPPTARTAGALTVVGTEAVVGGVVDARGQPTHFKFEYGPTRSYGMTADLSEEVVTGSGHIKVEGVLDGLKPRTTYHYRIVAINGSGSVRGDDRIFTTTRRKS